MITLASIEKTRKPTGYKPGPQINITPIENGNLQPKTVKHIVNIMTEHRKLKHKALIKLSGFGDSTVSRVVTYLVKKGQAERLITPIGRSRETTVIYTG